MNKLHFVAGLAGFVMIAAPGLAASSGISVALDQVRIVTFPSAAKTVYVGNPTIADVTVIDSTHVFVLGKSFGTTNIVALNNDGHQTFESQVTVLGHQTSMVTVQRGAARLTLNCAAERCEVAPTPGDDNAPYENLTGQVEKRQTQNIKAASGQ